MPNDPVRQFEAAFAGYQGAVAGRAFWMGRVGLYAVLRVLGVGPNDRVGTCAYTCVSVVGVVTRLRSVSVFVDVAASMKFQIVSMQEADAQVAGRLCREGIPEAIFARLGDRFAGRFLRWVQCEESSEVWVAKNADGEIVAMTAATLDRPAVYRKIVKNHAIRISLSVLASLHRPGVLTWVFRAICERLRPPPVPARSVARPAAELLVISITGAARGTGLAMLLVEHMETQFRSWGFSGSYLILTLSANARSNAFYRRIGAKFVTQFHSRGHLVNEYHKSLSSDAE